MKGILINPFAKTVTEINTGRDIKDIYKAISPDHFEVNIIERTQLKNGQDLWVDEEGTFKESQMRFVFAPTGFQMLHGMALILGSTPSRDNWDDTIVEVREIIESVLFE